MICTLEFRVIARVSPFKIGFTHFFTPKSTAPSYMRDGIHWATAPFGNPDQHVLTGAASSTSRVRPLHAACAAQKCTCTRERPPPPLKRRRVGFFSVCRSWIFFCGRSAGVGYFLAVSSWFFVSVRRCWVSSVEIRAAVGRNLVLGFY